jgi:hypothetical protein
MGKDLRNKPVTKTQSLGWLVSVCSGAIDLNHWDGNICLQNVLLV